MRYLPLLLVLFYATVSYGQTATNLFIRDTRDVNDLPSFNTNSIRADFKSRTTLGVPGTGNYSSNITISPWYDATGGLIHQLNFNDGGIYYRTGGFNSKAWSGWQKVVTEDNNKNIQIEDGVLFGRALFNTFMYDNKAMGHYALRWGSDSYTGAGPVMWQSAYGGFKFFTAGKFRMILHFNGNVGIGTEIPKYKLDVAGVIRAEEVKIEAQPWADFVFDKDYKLPSLDEVKAHIDEHKHLPNIPSEKEVQENGIGIGEMQAKLLQKIEELTLYVIDLKEKNEMQNKKIDDQTIQLKEQKLHIKAQNMRIKKLENR